MSFLFLFDASATFVVCVCEALLFFNGSLGSKLGKKESSKEKRRERKQTSRFLPQSVLTLSSIIIRSYKK